MAAIALGVNQSTAITVPNATAANPSSTSPIINPVTGQPFYIWDETPTEEYGRYSPSSASRMIRMAWNDRIGLITAAIGSATVIGGITVYEPPLVYPDAPWMILQKIRTVKCEAGAQWLPSGRPTPSLVPTYFNGAGGSLWPTGMGGDGNIVYGVNGALTVGQNGMIAGKTALTEWCYATDLTEEGCFELEVDTGADIVPQSGPILSYTPNDSASAPAMPVNPQDNPPIFFTLMTFSYTIKNVAALPIAQVAAAAAAPVNSDTISLPGTGNLAPPTINPGYLLYLSTSATKNYVGAGYINFTVTHRFRYKSVGWNTILQPNGWYTPVYQLGSTKGPYATSALGAFLPIISS